ncbi:hypothetical protein Aca07nite_44890 [Actinoplanes capillaceus]|uniref:Phage integrase, N-terminal SAM-like domain n=1 Tax=Actinoplanes campanulatus TaxID=113559 RepID=A0ABQ3WLU9_9ACTN|nr:hypothetical protein Aca07nite_44890 [Actinoplanes capillaceus]
MPERTRVRPALFRPHIEPILGHLPLGAVKPQTIRSWRGKLLAGGTTEPQAVKSYSLLRAILNTAVREDEIRKQNPCRIPVTAGTTPRSARSPPLPRSSRSPSRCRPDTWR